MITIEPIHPKQKLLIAFSTLLLMVLVLCGSLLVTSDKFNKNINTNSSNLTANAQTYNSLDAYKQKQGVVQGASTENIITVTDTPVVVDTSSSQTPKYSINIDNAYTSSAQIILQGQLPKECLNNDGVFCRGNLYSLNDCPSNNCVVGSDTTLTPDRYNSWKYAVLNNLQPGKYLFAIKSSSKNYIENINFTVK